MMDPALHLSHNIGRQSHLTCPALPMGQKNTHAVREPAVGEGEIPKKPRIAHANLILRRSSLFSPNMDHISGLSVCEKRTWCRWSFHLYVFIVRPQPKKQVNDFQWLLPFTPSVFLQNSYVGMDQNYSFAQSLRSRDLHKICKFRLGWIPHTCPIREVAVSIL